MTDNWMYEYQAEVVRVIDGDTVVLKIDLGFHLSLVHHVRFYGVNAPELNTPEGKIAKVLLEERIPPGTQVVFDSYKDKPDKYGRLLGTIFLGGKPV